MVSIDAYGLLNTYIRNGSDWDQLVDNLHKISRLNTSWICIGSVLNMYNIFDIHQLVNYIRQNFPNMLQKIQFVSNEPELDIRCLPYELRDQAIQSLESIIGLTKDNSYVIEVINLLKLDNYNPEGFANFIRYAKIFDINRNENLASLIPQYAPYYNVQNNTSN